MRIQIKRRGGLAGVTLRADLDTAELGSQTGAHVEEAVARLLTGTEAARTPHPDAFEYEITIPSRGDSVSVGEHELPRELEPLVEHLSKVGHLDRSRGPSTS
jgi:hypothetical protein